MCPYLGIKLTIYVFGIFTGTCLSVFAIRWHVVVALTVNQRSEISIISLLLTLVKILDVKKKKTFRIFFPTSTQ